ncbi:g5125 [Coccomyxa elongata]
MKTTSSRSPCAKRCLHTPQSVIAGSLKASKPNHGTKGMNPQKPGHGFAPSYSWGQLDAEATAARVASAQEASTSTPFQEMTAGRERKYVMVSGKGGVGKTSLAASLAVQFAADGHNTLVVSTDPAHSLSDSLAQDVSGGKPVPVEGTALPLWGLEIDPDRAKEDFRAFNARDNGKGTKDFMSGMGLGMITEQLADLKLGELLDTPPPGLDEAVAIAKVVEFVRGEEYARFSRIVFDTAPTGHTLRLLTVPDFVEAALGKLIRLRKKLTAAGDAVRGIFGVSNQDVAIQKLEALRDSVIMVRDLFRNEGQTEFIIATIPTMLGVNESARLIKALRKERIPCSKIVVNQIVSESMGEAFVRLRLKDQAKSLAMIGEDRQLSDLRQIRAPLVDYEVRGLPALTYFGGMVWRDAIDAYAQGKERKYFMLGGKGGVGKTSSAASLAVQLATAGHPTLIVSTDPAHSLSDSLDQDVSGGKPVAVQGTDLPLWGMEIDVAAAAEDIRAIGREDDGMKQVDEFLGGVGLGAVAEQLKDLRLSELLDTLPPGVDEAVAISKVVAFTKNPDYAHFTRIIFDTAPTGHTLRLLTLPDFLDASLGKIVRLRQKLVDMADSVKGLFGVKKQQDNAVEKMERLKARMEDARALFRNPETTEFVIVTIPTVMAVAESARLAEALRSESVPVSSILINQVLKEDATEKFMATRRREQQRALQKLREDAGLGELDIIEAPLFDLEVRGVPALQYFGGQVWDTPQEH